jgi:hypothetical protein
MNSLIYSYSRVAASHFAGHDFFYIYAFLLLPSRYSASGVGSNLLNLPQWNEAMER